ncbi:dephospho-CoA kinase [Pareuzebyella sediminis]|uniref:dephospho-CoA kinase n=1 Tax=Pareuzebyella sediminis TaxID=2607998 RepID=UPI002938CFBC|nr:dephospho-CoA kinase [Pareuzebyella sediminis]
MIVGLTGGIGSGKTTVGTMFEELGVPVYNSDEEAKKLMGTSRKVRNAIVRLLGELAYPEGELDRAYISERIFANESLLKKMNAIVHPAVRKHFLRWAEKQKSPYVIQETAIIFEIGSQEFYDRIILVTAPRDIRIERIMKRNENISKKSVLERIQNQWKDSEKIKGSDYVIRNLDLARTRSEVLKVHQSLLASS